ncbi:hypothetical protein D9M71_186570 [compost metagenome]
MGLCAILDHFQVVLVGKRHDRVHVARPTRQVNTHDRTSFRCQHRLDTLRRDVLGVAIHVCKHRVRARIDDTRYRGQKCPRGNDDFITRPDAQGLKGQIQGDRTIGQRDGIIRTGPGGKLFLKLAAFLPSPVIDFIGENYITNRVGLYFGKRRPRGKRRIKHSQYPLIQYKN